MISRTWQLDYELDFAMVSNETIKAKLREFVEYCKKNFEVFVYWLLFDANGGWGLAESDARILRESGIACLRLFKTSIHNYVKMKRGQNELKAKHISFTVK